MYAPMLANDTTQQLTIVTIRNNDIHPLGDLTLERERPVNGDQILSYRRVGVIRPRVRLEHFARIRHSLTYVGLPKV